jgi:serine/threonine protein kinase
MHERNITPIRRFDCYQETEFLTEGLCGDIYHGIDIIRNRPVIIKHIRKKFPGQYQDPFEKLNAIEIPESDEVHILHEMQHPNIISVYAYFEDINEHQIVFEKAIQGDLFEYIKKIKPSSHGLPLDLCKEIFQQLVSAISYIHSKGYVHLDLKLENILIFDDCVKICDFGLSQSYIPGLKVIITKGSILYAAPEIIFSNELEPRTADVWSLGVILYMMLFNQPHLNTQHHIISAHEKLRKKGLEFPWKIPNELENLLRGILDPYEESRFTLDSVKTHAWLNPEESINVVELKNHKKCIIF